MHIKYIIFLILIFGFCVITTVSAQKPNFISKSENGAVPIYSWIIAQDLEPEKEIGIISDSLWKPLAAFRENTKSFQGNWILKTEVTFDDSVNSNIVWGLFPKYYRAAYEIFWDGTRIGKNGTIEKTREEEKPGKFDFNVVLPSRLTTPGKHTLIIRVSNHQDNWQVKKLSGNITIAPYETQLRKFFQTTFKPILTVGVLLIPFFFNLFLFFARGRKSEHLLFGLFCLTLIVDFSTYLVGVFADVSTIYFHWMIFLYNVTATLTVIMLPVFLIFSFSFSKKLTLPIILLNISIFFFFKPLLNNYTFISLNVLIVSTLIVLPAIFLKREGSLIIGGGLALAWVTFFFGASFVGLAATMALCTSLSIALQFAGKEKAEQKALLQSAHLENELLKKNINPHFLLNSLTSIIAWLRRDPSTAIKLIESLAEEFKLVTQISALKLIPIQQEIDLCSAHLKIMCYRKDANFTLVTKDINQEETIPPMIFHTLIENGLTHGYENKNEGTFTLTQKQEANTIEYILTNDGECGHDGTKKSSGFGMQYIKARLEESYPGKWKVETNKNDECWEVKISIEKR